MNGISPAILDNCTRSREIYPWSSVLVFGSTMLKLSLQKPKKKQNKFNTQDEPLLRDNPRRFVIFPIKYHDIWQFYKKAEGIEAELFSESYFPGPISLGLFNHILKLSNAVY